jgi:hypothetical protein
MLASVANIRTEERRDMSQSPTASGSATIGAAPRQHLAAALVAIEELSVPAALQPTVLAWLLRQEVAARPGEGPGVDGAGQSGGGLDQLAARLGLPVERLEHAFAMGENGVEVVVPARRLDSRKTGATRQIAILLACARQGSGVEDWTATSLIRDACRDYGRLDSPNFSTALSTLDDVAVFKGSGSTRAMKLTRPGFDAARTLVEAMAREGLTS